MSEQRWNRYLDEVQEWLDKAKDYGIELVHPNYQDDEVDVMGEQGAKGLRYSTKPNYLVMREAIRRHVKGKGSPSNNYIKLAVRTFERMKEAMVDTSGELLSTYFERPTAQQPGDIVRKRFGESDGKGNFWSPHYRLWFPFEEFNAIKDIDRLHTRWGGRTNRHGYDTGRDVGEIRREWVANGKAAEMIKEHNLPVDKFLPKLNTNFKSRKREKTV